MTELAAALGILLSVLTSCAARRQTTRAAPSRDAQNSAPTESRLATCVTRLCRLTEYAAAFQRGVVVEVSDDGQAVRTRPECAPLYWHRVSIDGTSGNAFDQTTQMLWIGRSSALVTETARLAGSTHTIDGRPSDDAAWQRLESRQLAVITLESVIFGMPEYHRMHDIDPPEPETTEQCSIVHMDSCTGRVGYVCSHLDVRMHIGSYPEPPDGRYIFELEVDPRVITYGLFNGEVLEVE